MKVNEMDMPTHPDTSNIALLHEFDVKYFLNRNKLSQINLLYLNINSLSKKLFLLEDHIKELGKIHFIALTEIRIKQESNRFFNLPNYTLYVNNRSDGDGGIALYVHDSLNSGLVMSGCSSNVNYLLVKIPELSINIAVVYKQPKHSNHEPFINCIDSILKNHGRVLLVGDMNVDLLKSSTQADEYVNTVLQHGFSILNRIEPNDATRVAVKKQASGTTTSRTIIDHIVSDLRNIQFTLSINNSHLSDHKQILIGMKKNNQSIINFNSVNTQTHYQIIDIGRFQSSMSLINWSEIESFDDLVKSLELCRDRSKKTIHKNVNTNPFKPWVNGDLLNLINERNRYFRLKKKSPTNEYLINKYNELNEHIKSMRFTLRAKRNQKRINENKSNPRKLWQIINQILTNKVQNRKPIGMLNNVNGETLMNPYDIGNEFNEYFLNVGNALYELIPPLTVTLPATVLHVQNTCVLFPTTAEEVTYKIHALRKNNSLNDSIPSTVLKSSANILAPILSDMINTCLHEGTFPSSIKLSRIIPIFKSGDPLLAENYRPISILPNVSKVFESILYDRLIDFLQEI